MKNRKNGSCFLEGISIIVPAKNEEFYIRRCIKSLLNQDFSGSYEIIVVDNMSTDKTRDIAEQMGVKVLRCSAYSPSAVRNYGSVHSQYDLLAFIDGDCEAPLDWIQKARAFLSKNGAVGAYGGPYTYPPEANWVVKAWAPNSMKTERVIKKGTLPGGNLFIWHSLFKDIDGFNEKLMSAEDDDLCNKVRKYGFTVLTDTGNAVMHHGYPASLHKMFVKAMWHGSTQLQAHGMWRDKFVLLTVLWTLLFFPVTIGLIINFYILFFLGLTGVLFFPVLLSLARLRKLSCYRKITTFFLTYTVALCVVAGRSLGLILELRSFCLQAVSRYIFRRQ